MATLLHTKKQIWREHTTVYGFSTVFLKWFTENWAENDIKKAAKLFIIIYLMPVGKELWKNGLFVSKCRIVEVMLTSCPGLEQLKFSV